MSEKISPKKLTLYYSANCPFCHLVFNALQSMNLTPDLTNASASGITLKDTRNSKFRDELITGGGKKTVPCLAISHEENIKWMYESKDIITFIQTNLSV